MNIAVVVVTFNRPAALERLLGQLSRAEYDGSESVPLVISVDGGGNEACISMAQGFEWRHGTKQVVVHPDNLGLKSHILWCGDLVQSYDGIIVLEDDIVVSPLFYRWATALLDRYGSDPQIGGVSLYTHHRNFLTANTFNPIDDGADVFFMQIACSWGQAWTKNMWNNFRDWLRLGGPLERVPIPREVISWPKSSWLKFYIAYLVDTGLFFVYPRVSLTSNFGEVGTHNAFLDRTYRVPVLMDDHRFPLRLPNLADSIAVYDSFFELHSSVLERFLNIPPGSGTESNLQGLKPQELLTGKKVLGRVRFSEDAVWGDSLKPDEANILSGHPGSVFGLVPVERLVREGRLQRFLRSEKIPSSSELVGLFLWKLHNRVRISYRRLLTWCSSRKTS